MSDRNKMRDRVSSLTKEEILVLAKKSFSFANVHVINYHLEPFSEEAMGFLGSHELLTIEARDSAYPKSSSEIMSYFVKTVMPGCNDFQKMVFKNESKFLSEVVPRMLIDYKDEAWAAHCYLALENALILENLKTQKFAVQESEFDLTHLKSMVETLARFHASSMLFEKQLKKPLCDVYPEFSREVMFTTDDSTLRSWLEAGIIAAEAVAKNLNINCTRIREGYEIALEKIIPVKGERNVFSHGDLTPFNLMFDENGEKCRIVDFQMASIKCYTIDLMQVLHMTIASEKRKMIEKELLEDYHRALNECLKNHGYQEQITLEEFLRDAEEKRICGIVSGVQVLPISCILGNKKLSPKFFKDVETLKNYMYCDRKDFVLEAVREDESYRNRIEGSVKDIVEYMDNL